MLTQDTPVVLTIHTWHMLSLPEAGIFSSGLSTSIYDLISPFPILHISSFLSFKMQVGSCLLDEACLVLHCSSWIYLPTTQSLSHAPSESRITYITCLVFFFMSPCGIDQITDFVWSQTDLVSTIWQILLPSYLCIR